MDELTDSDLAMVANAEFENILRSIRNSCLNYHLQVSPFSATISLRKTVVKDKAGAYIIPRHCEDISLQRENTVLEDKLNSLRRKYEELLSSYSTANENITLLQNSIKDRDNIIIDLMSTNKEERKVVETLELELSEKAARFQEEKHLILTEHQKEVNEWNQDFSKCMSSHRRLEEKYQKLSPKFEPSTDHVQPYIEHLPHPSSTSIQEEFSEASMRCNETNCYALNCLSGSDSGCANCKGFCRNLAEEDLFSSFTSHSIALSDPPTSNFSCITSLRSHLVGPITPKGDLFSRLEAQYQEERKNGCKQS